MKTVFCAAAVVLLIGSAMISMSHAGAGCCATGPGAGPTQADSFLPAPRTYGPPQAKQAVVRYTGAPLQGRVGQSGTVRVGGPTANALPSCCASPNGPAPSQAGAIGAPAGIPAGCGRGCCGGPSTTYQPTRSPSSYATTPVRNVVTPAPSAGRVYPRGVTRRYW